MVYLCLACSLRLPTAPYPLPPRLVRLGLLLCCDPLAFLLPQIPTRSPYPLDLRASREQTLSLLPRGNSAHRLLARQQAGVEHAGGSVPPRTTVSPLVFSAVDVR